MKQKQRFLFSLLMAIVMMAMSPTRVWGLQSSNAYSTASVMLTSCEHQWSETVVPYSVRGKRHYQQCKGWDCDASKWEDCYDNNNDGKCDKCGQDGVCSSHDFVPDTFDDGSIKCPWYGGYYGYNSLLWTHCSKCNVSNLISPTKMEHTTTYEGSCKENDRRVIHHTATFDFKIEGKDYVSTHDEYVEIPHTYANGRNDECTVCGYVLYPSQGDLGEGAFWNLTELEYQKYTLRVFVNGKTTKAVEIPATYRGKVTKIYVYAIDDGVCLSNPIKDLPAVTEINITNIDNDRVKRRITSIGKGAFTNVGTNGNLNEITIPKLVTKIGDNAFVGSKFNNLEFEDGSQLESLGDYLFVEKGSSNTATVNINFTGDSKPQIADNAFYGVTGSIGYPTNGGGWSDFNTGGYGSSGINWFFQTCTNHAWELVSSIPATCTTPTKEFYKCKSAGCLATKANVVQNSELLHNFKLHTEAKERTCTEDGAITSYKCERCGVLCQSYKVEANEKHSIVVHVNGDVITPALGHIWVDVAEQGLAYDYYDEQGQIQTFITKMKSKATCHEPAHYYNYCLRCFNFDETSDVIIGLPLGHKYAITGVRDVDLTSNEDLLGKFTIKCQNNGCTEEPAVIDIKNPTTNALNWQSLTLTNVIKQPTCQTGKGEYKLGYRAMQPKTLNEDYWTYYTIESVIPALDGAHDYDADGKCPYHSSAQAACIVESFDESGIATSQKGYTTFAEGLSDLESNQTIKLFTDCENTDEDGIDLGSMQNITFNLNGKKLSASSLNCTYSVTLKNGTANMGIDNGNIGFESTFTLDNATLNASSFQWMPNGAVTIKNGSTLNNSPEGNGRFWFEDCKLDATSKVVLTNVSEIGGYDKVPGGYKEIKHRITEASKQGNTITILGSDPIQECTFGSNYVKEYNYETGTSEYHLLCSICNAAKEGASITADEDGNLTTENFSLEDGAGFSFDKDITVENFSYPREVTGGNIVSFILPVAIPVNKINGTVWKFATYEDDTFKFNEVTEGSTQAHVPYLVVLNNGATGIIDGNLQNVLVKSVKDENDDDIELAVTGTDGVSKHIGTYTTQSIASDLFKSYYGYSKASGKFVKAKTGTLNPFRTMFYMTNPADSYTYSTITGSWTSTNKEDNSEIWSDEYSVTALAGDVFSFEWATSSEEGFDKLHAQVLKPGAEEYEDFFTASGSNTGEERYTMTAAGTYKFKFGYVKDSSGNSGNDEVSVSNIKHYTKASTSEAKAFVALQLGMDDEADNIIMVDADAIMGLGSPMYNLQGVRISKPQKGQIIIQNGKKTIY